MRYVGWPTRVSGVGTENALSVYSSDGTPGTKQWFGNGEPLYTANFVGSVATRPSFSPYAYMVAGKHYSAYTSVGEENGWLGFPTGSSLNSVQRFQGGCIKLAGSSWFISQHGNWPCTGQY